MNNLFVFMFMFKILFKSVMNLLWDINNMYVLFRSVLN